MKEQVRRKLLQHSSKKEIIEMCTQSNTYYTISYNREETTLQLTHEEPDNRETKEPDAELQPQ